MLVYIVHVSNCEVWQTSVQPPLTLDYPENVPDADLSTWQEWMSQQMLGEFSECSEKADRTSSRLLAGHN